MDPNASHTTAYIGLGSNLGDRELYLKRAIEAIGEHPEIDVKALSPIYETEPVGGVPQGAFFNMSAKLVTSLTAESLLTYVLEVEQKLGRTRDIRWGPRTIDIDLLLFGNETRKNDFLELPHPRMFERGFVLIPLAHIIGHDEPAYAAVCEQLKILGEKSGVKRWKTIDWHKESEPFVN